MTDRASDPTADPSTAVAVPDPREDLARLLSGLAIDPGLADDVAFRNDDPVYATPVRVGHAAAVSIAAATLAAFAGRARPEGFAVDVRLAALTTEGFRHVALDGVPATAPRDPLTGFYETDDGRFVFLHLNFPHHRARALARIEARGDRGSIAEQVRRWRADVLEDAVNDAGGCAAVCRTDAEWADTAQASAARTLPPVEILRIGDSRPEPLGGAAPPLAGVGVVDFTRVLAGPTCGRVLAELGAEVTRIDNPLHPDLPSYQLDANRLKRQVTLDLRAEAGRQALWERVRGADVFVQAYRPGVAERLHFGPDDAVRLRPGIVYGSLSAYGHLGPWHARRGFDSVLQAACGFAMQGAEPALLPMSPIDYVCGFLLAFGIAAALQRRAATGGSYLVRTSLVQAAQWIASLGTIEPEGASGRLGELVQRFSVETQTPAGLVRHLRSPMVHL